MLTRVTHFDTLGQTLPSAKPACRVAEQLISHFKQIEASCWYFVGILMESHSHQSSFTVLTIFLFLKQMKIFMWPCPVEIFSLHVI